MPKQLDDLHTKEINLDEIYNLWEKHCTEYDLFDKIKPNVLEIKNPGKLYFYGKPRNDYWGDAIYDIWEKMISKEDWLI